MAKPKFKKEQYLHWYEEMLLWRRFEEKSSQLYIQQKFGGFCHLYIGQEAIVAGTISGSRPTDSHMTAYRDHAHPLALGTDPRVLMAELYGRTTGSTRVLESYEISAQQLSQVTVTPDPYTANANSNYTYMVRTEVYPDIGDNEDVITFDSSINTMDQVTIRMDNSY